MMEIIFLMKMYESLKIHLYLKIVAFDLQLIIDALNKKPLHIRKYTN